MIREHEDVGIDQTLIDASGDAVTATSCGIQSRDVGHEYNTPHAVCVAHFSWMVQYTRNLLSVAFQCSNNLRSESQLLQPIDDTINVHTNAYVAVLSA